MSISVIITAREEEKMIRESIKILRQELPRNSELIVIAPDNPTLKVAKNFIKEDKRIKILKDPGKGKPTALNIIFRKTKSKVIILTDGDVTPHKNSVKLLSKYFKNPKIGAVSGKVIYKIKKKSLFYEWAKLSEKVFDKIRRKQDKEKTLWHPTGYLYAIRNGLVKKIPSNTLSDDALIGYLIKSKGYLIKYEPKAKVYVKFPTSILDFIKQKSRTRAGFLQLQKWFGFKGRRIGDEISVGMKDLFKVYGIRKIHKMILVSLIYLIAWLRAYWLIWSNKSFEKIWTRIESTKR